MYRRRSWTTAARFRCATIPARNAYLDRAILRYATANRHRGGPGILQDTILDHDAQAGGPEPPRSVVIVTLQEPSMAEAALTSFILI